MKIVTHSVAMHQYSHDFLIKLCDVYMEKHVSVEINGQVLHMRHRVDMVAFTVNECVWGNT